MVFHSVAGFIIKTVIFRSAHLALEKSVKAFIDSAY